MMSSAGRVSASDSDQYNRLFIIGARDCSTQDIRDAFEPFGDITDVYIPRSKLAHDSKGLLQQLRRLMNNKR